MAVTEVGAWDNTSTCPPGPLYSLTTVRQTVVDAWLVHYQQMGLLLSDVLRRLRSDRAFHAERKCTCSA
jgi:hypothetical protein